MCMPCQKRAKAIIWLSLLRIWLWCENNLAEKPFMYGGKRAISLKSARYLKSARSHLHGWIWSAHLTLWGENNLTVVPFMHWEELAPILKSLNCLICKVRAIQETR